MMDELNIDLGNISQEKDPIPEDIKKMIAERAFK